MSWFRLDDQGAFHAKVVKAGNEAYGAWCRAGQWCSAHNQDGLIPHHIAHLIAPARTWARALSAGLLDPTDADSYLIHDFNEYNPTETQVEARKARVSAARKAAGHIGGLKSAETRKQLKQTDPSNCFVLLEALASSNEANGSKQNEAPSRPVPSRTQKEITDTAPPVPAVVPVKSAKGTRLAADWRPRAATVTDFQANGVDALATLPEFVDYWIAVPGAKGIKADWDATFRNRVRQLIADGRTKPKELRIASS